MCSSFGCGRQIRTAIERLMRPLCCHCTSPPYPGCSRDAALISGALRMPVGQPGLLPAPGIEPGHTGFHPLHHHYATADVFRAVMNETGAVKKKGRAVGFCLTSIVPRKMSDKLDIYKIVLIPKSQSAEHFKQTLSRATCNAEGPCCPVFSECRVDLTIPVSLHTCPNVFPLSRIALSSLSGNP